jgi:hypothetical protein
MLPHKAGGRLNDAPAPLVEQVVYTEEEDA